MKMQLFQASCRGPDNLDLDEISPWVNWNSQRTLFLMLVIVPTGAFVEDAGIPLVHCAATALETESSSQGLGFRLGQGGVCMANRAEESGRGCRILRVFWGGCPSVTTVFLCLCTVNS